MNPFLWSFRDEFDDWIAEENTPIKIVSEVQLYWKMIMDYDDNDDHIDDYDATSEYDD